MPLTRVCFSCRKFRLSSPEKRDADGLHLPRSSLVASSSGSTSVPQNNNEFIFCCKC